MFIELLLRHSRVSVVSVQTADSAGGVILLHWQSGIASFYQSVASVYQILRSRVLVQSTQLLCKNISLKT